MKSRKNDGALAGPVEGDSRITEGPECDAETLQLFAEYLDHYARSRADVNTWFEIQRVRREACRPRSPSYC